MRPMDRISCAPCLRLARERPQLRVVADQRGNPTYAPHLADAILAIAAQLGDSRGEASAWGVYHAAASGETTWAGFAAAIVAAGSAARRAADPGDPDHHAPSIRRPPSARPTPASIAASSSAPSACACRPGSRAWRSASPSFSASGPPKVAAVIPGLVPGSSYPRMLAHRARWIPVTSTGMTGRRAPPTLRPSDSRQKGGAIPIWPTSTPARSRRGPRSTAPSASSPPRTGSAPPSAWAMLERGGNAFDAGVATAFTLQVVEPHLCGPGGDVPVMLYDAKARQARGGVRPGAGAGGRHHRPLSRPPRPRHRSRHRPAAGLRAGHVRDLHDDPARLRHHAPARRAGAGHRLCPQRLSAGRARLRHHRHRREAVPRALADLGRGLPAGRQGAGRQHAVHQRQARRDLRAHPEGSRGRRRRARGGDRAGAPRLEPGLRRRSHRRVLPHQRGDGRQRPAPQGRAHRPGHGHLAADASRSRCISTTATTAC